MTGNQWFNDRHRPEPDPVDEATPPVSFDGGARTPTPAPPPSMSVLIRRLRYGDGTGSSLIYEDG